MFIPPCQRRPYNNTRAIAFASVSLIALGVGAKPVWAQTATGNAGATSTTTSATPAPAASTAIKEITVTAERRSQNVQKVAASVVALKGSDLQNEGRISTTQILEDVPNVVVGNPTSGDNPNGNITIRGVQSTQQTGGGPGPSATATYVDDVYQGIGGDYDINRVEVLRGPQGTLYGRSATGGVVAFHTNDPVLGKYSVDLTGELGSYSLRQATAAINLPITSQVALRVAARQYDTSGYYNGSAGDSQDQEARVKLLYQPLSNLRFIAAWSINQQHTGTGGEQQALSGPNAINFDRSTIATNSAESHEHQYSLNTNYDFGYGNVTWIAALHNFTQNGNTGSMVPPQGGVIAGYGLNPLDQYHTEEIRFSSDPGSLLTWLVGGNFYSNAFKNTAGSIQTVPAPGRTGAPDTEYPASQLDNVFLFSNYNSGLTTDWGAFTEETYPVLDNLRITGGARLDQTRVEKFSSYLFNTNIDTDFNSVNPATNQTFVSGPSPSVLTFNNFTYKARVEYDLTPANMLYGLVATGFLPGDEQFSPVVSVTPAPIGPPAVNITFKLLPFQQERLTSFELGSKNRFLDNSLQFNADVFYYKYSGYQEAVNIAAGGPIPDFIIISVPVRMTGVEFDSTYRLTPDDVLQASGGYLDASITSYPNVAGVGATRQYAELSRLPGIAPLTLAASYAHTFEIADGSILVPRAEVRYSSAEYLSQATEFEAFGGAFHGPGGSGIAASSLPYDRVGAEAVLDVGATWTSANSMYSVTFYANNVTDRIYKSGVQLSSNGPTNLSVTPSAPRVFGGIVGLKF